MTKIEVSELKNDVLAKMLMEYARRTVEEQQWVLLEAASRLKCQVS